MFENISCNDGEKRDRNVKEVEAEALPELKASLEVIRSTAAEIIAAISPQTEMALLEKRPRKIYTR